MPKKSAPRFRQTRALSCWPTPDRHGPAAIDYYQSRFAYYLYPRKVLVFDEIAAKENECRYLAVFRDSAQNLANEPFAGRWNQADLSKRLNALDHVRAGELTEVYRVP